MIKICYLTSVHSRFDARIFHKECKSLILGGYNVSLIVADGKGNENIDNITIYDVGIEENRLNRLLKTSKKIGKLAIELNCEVYHFHDPELLFVGLKLKKLGKKVIFDMHENVPADISEKEYIPLFLRKLLSICYERIEIYAVKKIDAIVSTRDSITERLKSYNSNIKLITNFSTIEENINKTPTAENYICFAGAIVSNWQHKEIINALENIDNVKYLLAGPVEPYILKELQQLKAWNKVEYLGVISFEEVKMMYMKAKVGVALYVYCQNMDGKVGNLANTKLFEYMNWEIPIVCTDFTLWEEIVVQEEKCGICVNPYDINAISNAIKFILDNPKAAKIMGENGRKAVLKTYNWKTQEVILIDLYNQILNC